MTDANKKTQQTEITFRKEAIDYFSEPHSTTHLIQITKLWSWVVILPFAILIIAALFWSVFGSVAIWIEGNGIILPTASSLYSAVAVEGGAKIIDFTVNPKDLVKKGEILGYMDLQSLKDQFTESERLLKDLQKTYNDLKQTSDTEIQSHGMKFKLQNDLSQTALQNRQKHLTFLQDNLDKLSTDAAKKIITNYRIEDLKERIQNTVEDIERIKTQLIQDEVQHMDFIDKWDERLRDLQIKIQNASRDRDNLHQRLEASSKLLSPVDGIVIGLQKSVGDYVAQGDVIVIVLSKEREEDLEGIFYVDAEDGKKIDSNMKVLITPTHMKKEEFGSIDGKVSSISEFPVNHNRMLSILKNQELINTIFPTGSPFEVQVSLTKDPLSKSGFKWTSSKGENQKISSGMPIKVRVMVKEQRPISLIIPAFKKLFGE